MRIVIAIALFIGTIGVSWFYIWPAWTEINGLTDTRDQYDEALEEINRFRDLRDEYVAKFNSFSANDISRIQRMLPEETDKLRLFMNLDAVAGEYGIDITNLSIEDAEESDDDEEDFSPSLIKSSVVGFNFEATYPTMVIFLEDLESRLRLFDIASLSFSANNDEGNEYNYELRLQTYSL